MTPDTDNLLEKLIERLEPGALLAAVCVLLILAIRFRTEIYEFIQNYVIGRRQLEKEKSEEQEKENPNDQLIKMMEELKAEIAEIKETQSSMIDNQNDMRKSIETFQGTLNNEMIEMNHKIENISDLTEFLKESDREDKKAFITREYNYFCTRVGQIDLYSKEILEKIYEIYLKENGDTFVAGMMTAIRSLPMVPQIPKDKIDNLIENH